jgi:hypothetical protein
MDLIQKEAMKDIRYPCSGCRRLGRAYPAFVAVLLVGCDFVQSQSMPGETDPAASGFYLSGNIWFKAGKAVTGSGVSEFRVIDGKPFWKSANQYHYNSMDSETSSDWGYRGACTASGATCFFVFRGKVFYKSGSTFHCNDLSSYTLGSNRWGNEGACTRSGALDFRVVGRKVFYRMGTTYYHNSLLTYSTGTGNWGDDGPCTRSEASDFQVSGGRIFYRIGSVYYYNSLSIFPINVSNWGLDGACTQAGATNFRVSNGKPYWNVATTSYRNSIGLYSSATSVWSEITAVTGPLPPADAPDPAYDPCGFAYTGSPSAPTNILLSSSTVSENLPSGTPVGTFSTVDPNPGDTFTYMLVNGAGDDDNDAFAIHGSGLETVVSFNYEAMNVLRVRVRTSDQGGLTYEKALLIEVLDQSEQPFRILDISGGISTGFAIRWASEAGYFYQVRYSDTLALNDWHDLGGEQVADSGQTELSYTDVSAVGPGTRFYVVARTPFP